MSRYTTTRDQVRALANTLYLEGTEPTSTLILKRLGKGSPNTVVDELRKWKAARTAELQAPPASLPALQEQDSFGEDCLAGGPAQPMPARAEPNEENSAVETLTRNVAELTVKMSELDIAIQRLDGIRTMALKQIDEARGQARYWEEEARRLRGESSAREQAYRQAMYAAQSQADELRGQVKLLREQAAAQK